MNPLIVDDFSARMVALLRWNALIGSYSSYGNLRLPRGAKQTLPPQVLAIKSETKALGRSLGRISYEGAFLYACAEFEQVIRDLLREFALNLSSRKPVYSDLPPKLRSRLEGRTAEVLSKLSRDQYGYLTFDDIISRLHSSVRQTMTPTATPYDVLPEALSHTENNLRWEVLRELLEGVGCERVNSHICNYPFVRSAVGARTKRGAMSAIPMKLTDLMRKRNRIIHRNYSPFLPTDADVAECAKVFTAIAKAVHRLLKARLATL